MIGYNAESMMISECLSGQCTDESRLCDFCFGTESVTETCACEYGHKITSDKRSCQLGMINLEFRVRTEALLVVKASDIDISYLHTSGSVLMLPTSISSVSSVMAAAPNK